MTSISHALIGAAIASRIHDPYLVAGISLVTHFICDAIPHWDLGTSWRLRPRAITGFLATMETLTAIIGTYVIFSRFVNPYLLIIAIFMSLIPDFLEVPYYLLLPNSPRLFYLIYKAQSVIHSRLKAPWGVVTQVVVVSLFLWVGFVA